MNLINSFILRQSSVHVHGKVTINGRLSIFNQGRFIIGDGSRFNSGENFNSIGGSTRCVFVINKGAELSIGKRVGISNSAVVCWKRITIEDNVFVGGDCRIYDTDFHPIGYSKRLVRDKKLAKTAPVTIKNGVFIGAGSIILKGVTIGEKSIIGAGSVVAKNVPPGQIWAGNPARFIRKLTLNELK